MEREINTTDKKGSMARVVQKSRRAAEQEEFDFYLRSTDSCAKLKYLDGYLDGSKEAEWFCKMRIGDKWGLVKDQ